jgi:hypothetical protein
MNIKTIISLTPSTSKLAFCFACALVAGLGWDAKIGIDQFASICDETSAGFDHPSTAFFGGELRRTRQPAFNMPASPAIQRIPTNSFTPVM